MEHFFRIVFGSLLLGISLFLLSPLFTGCRNQEIQVEVIKAQEKTVLNYSENTDLLFKLLLETYDKQTTKDLYSIHESISSLLLLQGKLTDLEKEEGSRILKQKLAEKDKILAEFKEKFAQNQKEIKNYLELNQGLK